ncbi:MAG: hypothetical protein WCR76_10630, partial [Sphaerochaetaceae bacterium]
MKMTDMDPLSDIADNRQTLTFYHPTQSTEVSYIKNIAGHRYTLMTELTNYINDNLVYDYTFLTSTG